MTTGQAQPDRPAANPYRRPWWLIVNKSARLITTVREETRPGERVFIIRGEPLVQGLGWLIWGPVGALVVILLLAGLAIAFGISERGWGIKAVFVVAFLALPALAWAGIAAVLAHLSEKFLQAERQADNADQQRSALDAFPWARQASGFHQRCAPEILARSAAGTSSIFAAWLSCSARTYAIIAQRSAGGICWR